MCVMGEDTIVCMMFELTVTLSNLFMKLEGPIVNGIICFVLNQVHIRLYINTAKLHHLHTNQTMNLQSLN